MKTFCYNIATDQDNSLKAKMFAPVLWVLAKVYGVCVQFILFLHKRSILKQYRLSEKVICVGNITLGGTGKTPLVEFLIRLLKKNGFKPAVLTRGYMCQKQKLSDEAEQLRKSFPDVPVLVGSNRYEKAKEFLKDNDADVFIMDDGFQHWRLFRDLDIVAINSNNPFGNGCVIPRGIMREPLSSLKRAQMFVLTKIQSGSSSDALKERLKTVHPECDIVETVHQSENLKNLQSGENEDLSFLKGKMICSFCSIGDPDSFVSSLFSLGANIKRNFTFMDHHLYTKENIFELNIYCKSNDIKFLVTTQKDEAKLAPFISQFDDITLLSLGISIDFLSGEEKFINRVLSVAKKK